MKIQNNILQIYLLLLLFLLPGTGYSQGQVQVKLIQPPPNQLRAADIWKLNIINPTKSAIEVTLYGTLEEANSGVIIDGTSKPIKLAQGNKTITYDDVKSGNVNFKSGKWREAFTRTGNAPSGDYKICITVKDKSGVEIGSDCIDQKIEIASPPTLVTPADGDSIAAGQPVIFTWLSPMPATPGQNYKIRIVEILGNQSPEAAIQKSQAFFEKDGIRVTTFQYPAGERKFESGKKYAWNISSGDLKSETFSFMVSSASCGTIVDSIKVECMEWNENTGLPQYQVTLSLSNIPTSSANSCNAIYTSITTIPAGTGTITGIATLPLTITPNSTGSVQFIYSPPNLSTSSVTFGAYGTWTDAMHNTVNLSSSIDTLPNCLCHDCDSLQLNLNNFNITPQGSNGNQFNITGNVGFNQPIYGLEFQVQSFNYVSDPAACTEGVASIEQSGMFLVPPTTINNSSVLQMFNVNVTGSNNSADKTVKYISSTPLSGNIPVSLTIGLPGPLPGLNADCCKISYEVCIQVKAFYDRDACKSCSFIRCFEFNNK